MHASDEEKVQMVTEMDITRQYNHVSGKQDAYLNGENVESLIRTTDAMDNMELIIKCQPVRDAMAVLQRQFGEKWWIVADGRDMGTVVYPDADLKIFLECDLEIRVIRRVKQLQEQWLSADPDAIRKETITRDTIDYLWPNAVGKKADDAIIVDTTHMTIEGQVNRIVAMAREID